MPDPTAPVTGDLRDRLIAKIRTVYDESCATFAADALLSEAESLLPLGDLPERVAEAIRREFDKTAIVCEHTQVISFGALAAAALSERWPAGVQAHAEAAEARRREEHAVAGHEVTKEQLAKVERELAEVREENAYLQPAMRGAENRRQIWRERAEAAEAQVAALQRQLADAQQLAAEWQAACEAQSRDAEVLTDAVQRVRALHSPEEDPRRTRDCKGCRTVATFTYYEDCKTLAALDARPDDPEEIRRLAASTETET